MLKALAIYFITEIISYIASVPSEPLSVYAVHTTLPKT